MRPDAQIPASVLALPPGPVGLLFSGGLDSTSALAVLSAAGRMPTLIEIDHALRPRGEVRAAERIAMEADAPRVKLRVDISAPSSHALTAPPSGLLLVLMAEHVARQVGVQHIVMATVREDWELNEAPQASAHYYAGVRRLLFLHSAHPVHLHLPFYQMTKRHLAHLGMVAGAPQIESWSCTADGMDQCGTCRQCLERKSALGARVAI